MASLTKLGSKIAVMAASVVLISAVLAACNADKPIPTPTVTISPPAPAKSVKGDDLGYGNLNPDQLEQMLKQKDFLLINVNIPPEPNLPKTDLAIPFNEMDKNLDKLPIDKGARIVLYDQSGPMSVTAARKLVGLGFTNVLVLETGIRGWTDFGHKLNVPPANAPKA